MGIFVIWTSPLYNASSLLILFLPASSLLLLDSPSMERNIVRQVSLRAADESRMLSTDEMRPSSWDWDSYLDEIIGKTTLAPDAEIFTKAIGASAGEICGRTGRRFQDSDVFFSDDCSADINSTLIDGETKNPLLSCGKLAEVHCWSHSTFSGTIDSQSSMCVASPPSANQPTGQSNQGANSCSSHELSNDEDECEQSTDPSSAKRISRKLSNRDFARRSRTKKKAHLTELECQVVNLQEENACLYNSLTDATQLNRDADTNNRVLKSDVEALRAKVKLAEDMVARGSLSYSLNQLLLNQLNIAMAPPLRTMSNVTPTMSLQGDGVSHAAMTASGWNSGNRLGSLASSSIIDDNTKSSMAGE